MNYLAMNKLYWPIPYLAHTKFSGLILIQQFHQLKQSAQLTYFLFRPVCILIASYIRRYIGKCVDNHLL